MESLRKKRIRAKKIIIGLETLYGDAGCTLEFVDPFQLLISTQLAAQCTDERVNIVTKSLYEKYRSVQDFAQADLTELENDIRPTGFFHNKARNIKNCCQKLLSDYGGAVPDTMDELLKLPGVGRKTANLVLGDAYGVPGVVVDTHAGRLARRMGFTEHTNPEKVETDVMEIIPKDKWTGFCHHLVYHGRAVCSARKPLCSGCLIAPDCPKII